MQLGVQIVVDDPEELEAIRRRCVVIPKSAYLIPDNFTPVNQR